MQQFSRRAVLRAIFGAIAANTVLNSALAETPQTGPPPQGAPPFANAVAPEDLARLRGGASVNGALPAVRLWDEVGGPRPGRQPPPGAATFSDGTLTIRPGAR